MSHTSGPTRPRLRLFTPILAGATLGERLVACLGACLGVALTGLVCGLVAGQGSHLPLLVAPAGASAVLLFAVPASPLAQPWSIVGGNTLSAATGLLVATLVPEPAVAAGLAVALAIAVMSFARCLHPPGGPRRSPPSSADRRSPAGARCSRWCRSASTRCCSSASASPSTG